MMDRYGVIANVYKCYKARSLAHNMLKDTLEQHYTKLWRFLEEQKRIDLRGCFILQTDLDEATNKCIFKRLYMWVPWVFDPASPRRRLKRIKAQKRPKHLYMNRDPGLNSSMWASMPPSSRFPSLKRWSASDFPADSLTIEEHILPQTTYETAPKKITNL